MLSFLRELFPYLVAFYVLDALAYVRRGARLFVSPWGTRFRMRGPGMHWIGPSPTAESVAAYAFPGAVTERGVYAPRRGLTGEPAVWEPDDLEPASFEALGGLTLEGRELRAGPWGMELGSAPAARHWAGVLRDVRDAPPAERPRRLRDALGRASDVEAARALRACHARVTPIVAALSAALFAAVFGLLPWSLFSDAEARPPIRFVGIAIAIAELGVVAAAAWMLRRCGAGRRDAAWALACIVVFPPAAMHALTAVSRELYARFEPPALAAALLPEDEFTAYARAEWHRLEMARERSAGSDLERFWEMRLEVWREMLERSGRSVEWVLRPPPRADASAVAYCPLCTLQYTRASGTCADCGVLLRPFPAA